MTHRPPEVIVRQPQAIAWRSKGRTGFECTHEIAGFRDVKDAVGFLRTPWGGYIVETADDDVGNRALVGQHPRRQAGCSIRLEKHIVDTDLFFPQGVVNQPDPAATARTAGLAISLPPTNANQLRLRVNGWSNSSGHASGRKPSSSAVTATAKAAIESTHLI